jgi:hypothetical protein
MLVRVCNYSIGEVQIGESWVQGHPGLVGSSPALTSETYLKNQHNNKKNQTTPPKL